MTTYVFEGVEVKKTGREAIKELKTPAGKPARTLILYEVTPVADFDWKKWAPPEQLYEVRETE